jgi:mannose-1-phosphate guanylyltransferase
VKISYIRDDPKLKGTAGSVLNAYTQGLITRENILLVYYGDILTNMNLEDLIKHHVKQQAAATVALASGFTVKVGLADLDERGQIRGFVEKPTLEKPVSVGILVFDGKTLKDMESLKEDKPELDLMKDVVPYLIKSGKSVCGYLSDAFWYDVGSTEAYEKLNPKVVEDSLSYLFE